MWGELCRSPVLRTMLSTNMVERNTARIVLSDLTLQTGRDLVSFLYNGQLEPNVDLVDLLVAADKYDIRVFQLLAGRGGEQGLDRRGR